MADPFFDRPLPPPERPRREGSPLGGLALAVALVGLIVVVMQGFPVPAPGPGPKPDDGAVVDLAKTAEVAGKVEDRLYDARYKAHEPVHKALNETFPRGSLDDLDAKAGALREIAKGYRRSGK